MLNVTLHQLVALKTKYFYKYYISIPIILLVITVATLTLFPFTTESEPSILFTVSVNKANLRDAPSSNGRIIAVIEKNKQLKLLSTQSDWVRLELLPAGKVGWMHVSVVSENGRSNELTLETILTSTLNKKRNSKPHSARSKISSLPHMTSYTNVSEFKKFKESYAALLKFSLLGSITLFTKILHLPVYTLYIETSEHWSILERPQQNNHLDTTYNIWLAAITGEPGLIFLYNSSGTFIRSFPKDRATQNNF